VSVAARCPNSCYTGAAVSGGTERIISVAELHRRLKGVLMHLVDSDWVEGEVAGLKWAPSGHVYFTLKDEEEDAVIDAVMYKFNAGRARKILEEGARLQLSGRASVYPPRGRLQFVAERARPAGRGALLEALERLKAKLEAEGLFAAERKRALPDHPRTVGVVTSRSGAALHDIISVAFRRADLKIVLAPALVQGDDAPASLIQALQKLERYPGLDVVIFGRGGGSFDDLMAFNDERVVRRVAACRVPIVSAVGHEVDVTLTDFAADVRAATPSQAAELVVPDGRARQRALAQGLSRLGYAARAALTSRSAELTRLRMRIGDPRFLIAERQQALDELSVDLERLLHARLRKRRDRLGVLHQRVLSHQPNAVIARARARLGPLDARLKSSMRHALQLSRSRLGEPAHRLEALSPLAVLSRGYAIVQREDGTIVTDASSLDPGLRIEARLRRGRVSATVDEVHSEDET